ncbi:ABC-type branched-subunit amino acid transport system permease subunit [Rhodococcus sp. OAS809]
MTLFLERLISGLTNGSIYAILALALVVVFRATGTINFAQGELALFTTFVAWWLTTMSWPIWAAIGAALALGFLLGALMERLLIRPVQRRSDMAVLIVALGLFTGLNSLAGMLWGSETKIMPSPFPNGPTDYISVGGARVYGDALGVLVALVVLLVLMSLLFRKTRVGLHMRAVADNAESATLAGVPTSRILAIGWGVCGSDRRTGRCPGHSALAATTRPHDHVPDLHRSICGSAVRRSGQSCRRSCGWVDDRCSGIDAQRLHFGHRRFAAADIRATDHRGDPLRQTQWTVRYQETGAGMTTLAERNEPAVAEKAVRRPRVVVAGSTSYRILQLVLLVAAVCALLLVSQSAPFRVGQFTSVFIIAIAIAGLNIVSGYTGLLSIGHSAFFGLGAYTTGVLIVDRGYSPLTTIPMAVVLCFVLGLLVGLPSLRIKGLYLALVTLAVAVAFPEVIRKTGDLTGGAAGMVVRANLLVPPKWTGLTRADTYLWIFWVSVVTLAVVMLLIRNLVKSRFGLAMVAVRDNEIAASANGINVARVKILAFGLSGAITGLAGSLFTMYIGALSPESFSLMKSIEFITGLVLGGIATQFGPIVGATAVVFLPYYTGSVTDGPVSGVVFGAVLIAIVFLMPDGIVGRINSVLRRFVLVVPADHPKYREGEPRT